MRTHIWALVPVLALATPAAAQTVYKTKANYVACTSKAKVQQALRLVSDNRAFEAFMADPANNCTFLPGGVRVYLESSTLSLVEIRPVGKTGTVWTPREAITQ